MARQFDDGFDIYGNATAFVAGYPWDTVSGPVVSSTADGRFAPPAGLPGGCASTPQNNWIRKNLVGNQATLIVGFGFKAAALPGSGQAGILDFWDSGNFQLNLAVTAAGALQFWRGNGLAPGGGGQPLSVQVGATSPNGTIQPNVWYGIIVVVTFNGSTGSVAIYLNGSATALISSSGLNTAPSGNAWANMVSIGNINNNMSSKYDDFFCWDSTGAVNNAAPLTDVRIITKVPSQAGNYTNWTPNGLASNWQNVSQMPPNVADYNANNTPGTKDSYGVPSAGLALSPLSVTVRASLWRDDGLTHTPSLMVRSAGTDGVGAALPALGSSPAIFDTQFVNDPATGAPWTAAAADAAEIGVVEG